MKRIRILVTVVKECTYDYNPLYMTEGAAVDLAYDEAIQNGENKSSNLEDYTVEDLEEDPEQESA